MPVYIHLKNLFYCVLISKLIFLTCFLSLFHVWRCLADYQCLAGCYWADQYFIFIYFIAIFHIQLHTICICLQFLSCWKMVINAMYCILTDCLLIRHLSGVTTLPCHRLHLWEVKKMVNYFQVACNHTVCPRGYTYSIYIINANLNLDHLLECSHFIHLYWHTIVNLLKSGVFLHSFPLRIKILKPILDLIMDQYLKAKYIGLNLIMCDQIAIEMCTFCYYFSNTGHSYSQMSWK